MFLAVCIENVCIYYLYIKIINFEEHYCFQTSNIKFHSTHVADSKMSRQDDFFDGTDMSFGPIVAEM